MGIRTAANAQLGTPAFTSVSDTALTQPGTIAEGFDDVANITNEYIYLKAATAAIVAGDEVTYDTAYLATEVGAGLGQATAIAAPALNQYAWFRLKRRAVVA